MNLATGEVITHPQAWEHPVTQIVINAVEQMAAWQGIKSLKLSGRNKQPLFPADWTAWVDYEGGCEEFLEDFDDDYQPQDDSNYYADDDEYPELYDRIDP